MLICLEMQIISFVDGGSVWVIVKKFAPDEHSGIPVWNIAFIT